MIRLEKRDGEWHQICKNADEIKEMLDFEDHATRIVNNEKLVTCVESSSDTPSKIEAKEWNDLVHRVENLERRVGR